MRHQTYLMNAPSGDIQRILMKGLISARMTYFSEEQQQEYQVVRSEFVQKIGGGEWIEKTEYISLENNIQVVEVWDYELPPPIQAYTYTNCKTVFEHTRSLQFHMQTTHAKNGEAFLKTDNDFFTI